MLGRGMVAMADLGLLDCVLEPALGDQAVDFLARRRSVGGPGLTCPSFVLRPHRNHPASDAPQGLPTRSPGSGPSSRCTLIQRVSVRQHATLFLPPVVDSRPRRPDYANRIPIRARTSRSDPGSLAEGAMHTGNGPVASEDRGCPGPAGATPRGRAWRAREPPRLAILVGLGREAPPAPGHDPAPGGRVGSFGR